MNGDVPILIVLLAVPTVAAGSGGVLAKIGQDVATIALGGLAVADDGVEPVIVPLADVIMFLLGQQVVAAVFDEIFGRLHIAVGVEQDAVRRFPISAGTAGLLIVRL